MSVIIFLVIFFYQTFIMEMLGAALLISNSLNDSLAEEIQQIVGSVPAMEELSCKCEMHSNKEYFSASTSKCSSVIAEQTNKNSNSPSDSGNETVSGQITPLTIQSDQETFILEESDVISNLENGDSGIQNVNDDDKSKYDSEHGRELVKQLNDAIEAIENIQRDIGFQNEIPPKDTIYYNNRNILDLGSNITGKFNIAHPTRLYDVRDIIGYHFPPLNK